MKMLGEKPARYLFQVVMKIRESELNVFDLYAAFMIISSKFSCKTTWTPKQIFFN